MSSTVQHVFGPVPSRRLGRSLGVDLVPFKTCSYDCVYCQLGRTTDKTVERKNWVNISDVLAEVKDKLHARPDYVTLSGSGEPTLHCRIADVIDGIKTLTDIPLAVLTNGSLLWQDDVRDQLQNADVVIPSLDAGNAECFGRINRPHPAITFDRLVDGLKTFRDSYRGGFWLEVFLVAGLNSADAEVASLIECAEQLRPDRVQVNTVSRPPAETSAAAVSCERLQDFSGRFRPRAEVIGEFTKPSAERTAPGRRDEVLALLRRRPCTLTNIANGLALHPNEVSKYVEALIREGLVFQTTRGDDRYYRTRS